MIVNGQHLLVAAPIKDMMRGKRHEHGVSSGLGEAGYDIRIKQEIVFNPRSNEVVRIGNWEEHDYVCAPGNFVLASAIEEFHMPNNLVGVVHDKSTWARKRLSVFNTVIEPGWKGFLTLELVYHGFEELRIPAGAGIAQVLFHTTTERAQYEGKYQDQENEPVAARSSNDHHQRQQPDLVVGRLCPECGEPQFACPSGIVCSNGHGYAQ